MPDLFAQYALHSSRFLDPAGKVVQQVLQVLPDEQHNSHRSAPDGAVQLLRHVGLVILPCAGDATSKVVGKTGRATSAGFGVPNNEKTQVSMVSMANSSKCSCRNVLRNTGASRRVLPAPPCAKGVSRNRINYRRPIRNCQ